MTTLLAAGVGYTVANDEPEYLARSTLYVGETNVDPNPVTGEFNQDRIAAFSTVAFTFAKMIDSAPIAQRAVDELGLGIDSADVVEATETTPDLQLLYIDVTDDDPEVAQALSNGLADAFVEAVQEFEPPGGDEEGAVPRLPAYVFERASLPTAPVPTDQFQSVLLSALFGLVASVGIAFLLDYLDLSIRTASDVERRLELPVLGVIPALGDDVPLGQWSGGGRRGRKG